MVINRAFNQLPSVQPSSQLVNCNNPQKLHILLQYTIIHTSWHSLYSSRYLYFVSYVLNTSASGRTYTWFVLVLTKQKYSKSYNKHYKIHTIIYYNNLYTLELKK